MIKVEDLIIGYDEQIVLKDVNLQINDGEYVCIVGKNGSGKSTLLKTLLGLVKPISGKIIIDEKLSMGYVPQALQIQQDFPATVTEIVMSGCLKKMKLFPFYTKKERNLATKYIKMLQISSLRNKSFSQLSGGQQQRVLIARALCATDKVIFLDEPFTGLDGYAALKLYSVLRKINRDELVTIVIVTHDIAQVLRYADRIIQVDGRIVFDGTKDDYQKSNFVKDIEGVQDNA